MKKKNKLVNDEASSGGSIPLPLNSKLEDLISFGLRIKFIGIWIKSFKTNYESRI